jgi:hypothetical protein
VTQSLPSRLAGLIRDGLVIGGAAAFLLSIVLTGVWAIYGGNVTAFLRSELGIDDLSTQIRTLAGEDRIIRQPTGLSYVSEPVHVGETVVLNLVLQRTTRGMSCRFLGGQSLFRDASGIVTPGSPISPMQQVTDQQTRIRLDITPPPTLRDGRVELHISLEYECQGERVFDKTDVVTFELLP